MLHDHLPGWQIWPHHSEHWLLLATRRSVSCQPWLTQCSPLRGLVTAHGILWWTGSAVNDSVRRVGVAGSGLRSEFKTNFMSWRIWRRDATTAWLCRLILPWPTCTRSTISRWPWPMRFGLPEASLECWCSPSRSR